MFQSVLVVSSVLAVAAFVPARVAPVAGALRMSYETAPGVQAPAGFFDPLGKDDSKCL